MAKVLAGGWDSIPLPATNWVALVSKYVCLGWHDLAAYGTLSRSLITNFNNSDQTVFYLSFLFTFFLVFFHLWTNHPVLHLYNAFNKRLHYHFPLNFIPALFRFKQPKKGSALNIYHRRWSIQFFFIDEEFDKPTTASDLLQKNTSYTQLTCES